MQRFEQVLARDDEEEQHQKGRAERIEGDEQRLPAGEPARDRDEDRQGCDRIENDEQGHELMKNVVRKDRAQASAP